MAWHYVCTARVSLKLQECRFNDLAKQLLLLFFQSTWLWSFNKFDKTAFFWNSGNVHVPLWQIRHFFFSSSPRDCDALTSLAKQSSFYCSCNDSKDVVHFCLLLVVAWDRSSYGLYYKLNSWIRIHYFEFFLNLFIKRKKSILWIRGVEFINPSWVVIIIWCLSSHTFEIWIHKLIWFLLMCCIKS